MVNSYFALICSYKDSQGFRQRLLDQAIGKSSRQIIMSMASLSGRQNCGEETTGIYLPRGSEAVPKMGGGSYKEMVIEVPKSKCIVRLLAGAAMGTEANLLSPGLELCTCHTDRTNTELVKLNSMTQKMHAG